MIAVALKGLAGRKVRALLTAFAVVIGVSMVSGTFILTDTMQKTFDGLFDASYEGTDAVIAGRQIVKTSTSPSATLPAGLLDRVKALPEVGAAAGAVNPQEVNAADILGRDGKPVAQESMGASVDPANTRFSPFKLKTGAWPAGPRQVVIDAGTAQKHHFAVGDTVKVATTPGPRPTSSPARRASATSTRSASAASRSGTSRPRRRVLDRAGRYDTISLAAAKGTSADELVRAVRPLLPAALEVKDTAAQADEASAQLDKGMAYVRYFLLGFGGIALFVGAFVIYNTLSITVAQRTREFATLRTLGASRKQVLRSVRLEGLVLGLLASTIGLFLGFGIAKGMLVLFSALGSTCREADTVFALRTVLVSLAVGTGITLLATMLPARRATRVPPIAAVREGSTLPASRLADSLGGRRARRRARVRGGHLAPASSAAPAGSRIGPAARARRDRPVPRHRAPGAAPRRAAGPRGRLAGAPRRRRRGRAGGRERAAQSRAARRRPRRRS